MANKSPNLKVNVNSDTSGFTKGMSSAKKELNAFEKTSSDALGKIAGALGVDTAQVQKLQEAFAGAGRKIADMGGEGNKALGSIVASAGKAATAIGAIGIGAAVTAFKLLNEEATAFKNTVQGANIELQTQAYLETYRQAMHDYSEGVGKSVAEAESGFQKWWGRTWQNIKSTAVNLLITPNTGNSMASAITSAVNQTAKAVEYATERAEIGEAVAGEVYELERKRKEQAVDLAKLNADIADYQNIARDATNSVAERQNAIAQIQTLIAQKKEMTVSLEQKLYELYKKASDQASDSVAAADALLAQQARQYDAERAITQEQTSLLRLQKTINTEAAKEAQIRKDTAEAIAKGVERQQELATGQIELFVSDESRRALQGFASKPIEVPVRLKAEEVKQQLLDLNEVVQGSIVEAVEGISEALGNLIGNLTNGEGGAAQFGQDMLEMFGGFAQKFGKVLVAFGVAVEAAKLSAESFNGIAAIAAGAALIAAGAAVKTIASNMASSMGSGGGASSYVASSSYGGAGGYANSTLQVEVTGTLTANGSQLVAVLNNESNRKSYTT